MLSAALMIIQMTAEIKDKGTKIEFKIRSKLLVSMQAVTITITDHPANTSTMNSRDRENSPMKE